MILSVNVQKNDFRQRSKMILFVNVSATRSLDQDDHYMVCYVVIVLMKASSSRNVDE